MPQNLKILSLKCPSCGGPLDVSEEQCRFSCAYCGSEQVVIRRGGTVTLKLIGDAIAKVQIGTDRTAAELAISRLRGDLNALQTERQQQALPLAARGGLAQVCSLLGGILVSVVTVGFFAGGATVWGWIGVALVAFAGWIFFKNESERNERLAKLNDDFDARRQYVTDKIAEYEKFVLPGDELAGRR